MTDKLIKFTADLDRHQLKANQPGSSLSCHVNIDSNSLYGTTNDVVTSASICLVFDCSLSMSGKKFRTAISTAKMIVDMLHSRHWISLVAFGLQGHTIFKHAVPSENEKANIKRDIDNIASHLGGSTNTAAGIKTGMAILEESQADADVIVILSDGAADSAEKAQQAAVEASRKGIQIFAVGIGESYDTEQLLNLVTPSNGAVFGDSDVDRIGEIFQHIISRIDQTFASKAKLEFLFDESVTLDRIYKTRPERALYNSLSINAKHRLDLPVGNIESNRNYEFLVNIRLGSHQPGTHEIIRVSLKYYVNYQGVTREEVQEVILTVDFTEDKSHVSTTNEYVSHAMRSASTMHYCAEVVDACSRLDKARALDAISELKQKCDDENNTNLLHHLNGIKSKVEKGQKISDKERNDFLLACTVVPPKVESAAVNRAPEPQPLPVEPVAPAPDLTETVVMQPVVEPVPDFSKTVVIPPPAEPVPDFSKTVVIPPSHTDTVVIDPSSASTLPEGKLYDFILLDPGEDTIRLLREIRTATNMTVAEIADIIRAKGGLVTVFSNKAEAVELEKKLTRIGAKVKIESNP